MSHVPFQILVEKSGCSKVSGVHPCERAIFDKLLLSAQIHSDHLSLPRPPTASSEAAGATTAPVQPSDGVDMDGGLPRSKKP
jgi:hypothetical protein